MLALATLRRGRKASSHREGREATSFKNGDTIFQMVSPERFSQCGTEKQFDRNNCVKNGGKKGHEGELSQLHTCGQSLLSLFYRLNEICSSRKIDRQLSKENNPKLQPNCTCTHACILLCEPICRLRLYLRVYCMCVSAWVQDNGTTGSYLPMMIPIHSNHSLKAR